MKRFTDYLFAVFLALWVGALWAFGFAAMLLFRALADRSLAGGLAGQLFASVAVFGMFAGAYALLYLLWQEGGKTLKKAVFWLVLLMLLLAVVSHFGINPLLANLREGALPRQVMESAVRDRFAMWHGVSSVLYLVQALLGISLLTQIFKR